MQSGSIEKNLDLASYLPKQIQGWTAEGQDEVYNPETIFKYIDGAAEVYLSYNFKKLLARHFTKTGSLPLIADFFDMGSPADAFGVYTHDLDGDRVTIGQDATYKPGLLSFWKNRFFVSLYAEEETSESKEALLSLGTAIAESIPQEGERPAIVDLLPAEYLNPSAVHYFHTHLILNYHFSVSNENILQLEKDTEAVLSSSGAKNAKNYLLIVRYPESGAAARAYESFLKAYMPNSRPRGLLQTKDGKWTKASLKESFIVIAFHMPSQSLAGEIIAKVRL